jgi:hypothetical protein
VTSRRRGHAAGAGGRQRPARRARNATACARRPLEVTCEGPSATTADDPSDTPRSAPMRCGGLVGAPARAPDSRSLRTAGHPRVLRGEPSCIAASRGVTSLRPLRPGGRRSSGRVVGVDRRCAAPRRALGGWARRRCGPDRRCRQATMRRAAPPSRPRADRSRSDDGGVAHLLAAVHPVHVPIPRFGRASKDSTIRLAHARGLTVALPRLRVKRVERRSRRAPTALRSSRQPEWRHAEWVDVCGLGQIPADLRGHA